MEELESNLFDIAYAAKQKVELPDGLAPVRMPVNGTQEDILKWIHSLLEIQAPEESTFSLFLRHRSELMGKVTQDLAQKKIDSKKEERVKVLVPQTEEKKSMMSMLIKFLIASTGEANVDILFSILKDVNPLDWENDAESTAELYSWLKRIGGSPKTFAGIGWLGLATGSLSFLVEMLKDFLVSGQSDEATAEHFGEWKARLARQMRSSFLFPLITEPPATINLDVSLRHATEGIPAPSRRILHVLGTEGIVNISTDDSQEATVLVGQRLATSSVLRRNPEARQFFAALEDQGTIRLVYHGPDIAPALFVVLDGRTLKATEAVFPEGAEVPTEGGENELRLSQLLARHCSDEIATLVSNPDGLVKMASNGRELCLLVADASSDDDDSDLAGLRVLTIDTRSPQWAVKARHNLNNAAQPFYQRNLTCKGCDAPLVGTYYSCTVCNMILCHDCHMRGYHTPGPYGHSTIHPMSVVSGQMDVLTQDSFRAARVFLNPKTLALRSGATYQFELRTGELVEFCPSRDSPDSPDAVLAYSPTANAFVALGSKETPVMALIPNTRSGIPSTPVIEVPAPAPEAEQAHSVLEILRLLADAACGSVPRPEAIASTTVPLVLPAKVPFAIDVRPETFRAIGGLLDLLVGLYFSPNSTHPTCGYTLPKAAVLQGLASLLELLGANLVFLSKQPLTADSEAGHLDAGLCSKFAKTLMRFFKETTSLDTTEDPVLFSAALDVTRLVAAVLAAHSNLLLGEGGSRDLLTELLTLTSTGGTVGPSTSLLLSNLLQRQGFAFLLPSLDASDLTTFPPLWNALFQSHMYETRKSLEVLVERRAPSDDLAQSTILRQLAMFQRRFLAMFAQPKPEEQPGEQAQTPAIGDHPLFSLLRSYSSLLTEHAAEMLEMVSTQMDARMANAEESGLWREILGAWLRDSLAVKLVQPFMATLAIPSFAACAPLSQAILPVLVERVIPRMQHLTTCILGEEDDSRFMAHEPSLRRALQSLPPEEVAAAEAEAQATEGAGAAPAAPRRPRPPAQTVESSHPYENNEDWRRTIEFPAEFHVQVRFDDESSTERRHDWLRVYGVDEEGAEEEQAMLTGNDFGAGEPMVFPFHKIIFHFHSDGSNVDWGFKAICRAIVPGEKKKKVEAPQGYVPFGVGEAEPTLVKSPHPYENNMDFTKVVKIDNATGYDLEFDPRCRSEQNYDWLAICSDAAATRELRKISGSSWPRKMHVDGPVVAFKFHSDGSNTEWGFEIKVIPCVQSALRFLYEMPWISDLTRSLALGASQLAIHLIRPHSLTPMELQYRNLLDIDFIQSGLDERVGSALYDAMHHEQDDLGNNPSDPAVAMRIVETALGQFDGERSEQQQFFEELISAENDTLGGWLVNFLKENLPAGSLGFLSNPIAERAVRAAFAVQMCHNSRLYSDARQIVTTKNILCATSSVIKARKKCQAVIRALIQEHQQNPDTPLETLTERFIAKARILFYVASAESGGVAAVLARPRSPPPGALSAFTSGGGGLSRVGNRLRSVLKRHQNSIKRLAKKTKKEAGLRDLGTAVLYILRSVPVQDLFRLFLIRRQKAIHRMTGLDAFHALLQHSAAPSLRFELLRNLGKSWQGEETALPIHYTHGLSGGGMELLDRIRKAFWRLYHEQVVPLLEPNEPGLAPHKRAVNDVLRAQALCALNILLESMDAVHLLESGLLQKIASTIVIQPPQTLASDAALNLFSFMAYSLCLPFDTAGRRAELEHLPRYSELEKRMLQMLTIWLHRCAELFMKEPVGEVPADYVDDTRAFEFVQLLVALCADPRVPQFLAMQLERSQSDSPCGITALARLAIFGSLRVARGACRVLAHTLPVLTIAVARRSMPLPDIALPDLLLDLVATHVAGLLPAAARHETPAQRIWLRRSGHSAPTGLQRYLKERAEDTACEPQTLRDVGYGDLAALSSSTAAALYAALVSKERPLHHEGEDSFSNWLAASLLGTLRSFPETLSDFLKTRPLNAPEKGSELLRGVAAMYILSGGSQPLCDEARVADAKTGDKGYLAEYAYGQPFARVLFDTSQAVREVEVEWLRTVSESKLLPHHLGDAGVFLRTTHEACRMLHQHREGTAPFPPLVEVLLATAQQYVLGAVHRVAASPEWMTAMLQDGHASAVLQSLLPVSFRRSGDSASSYLRMGLHAEQLLRKLWTHADSIPTDLSAAPTTPEDEETDAGHLDIPEAQRNTLWTDDKDRYTLIHMGVCGKCGTGFVPTCPRSQTPFAFPINVRGYLTSGTGVQVNPSALRCPSCGQPAPRLLHGIINKAEWASVDASKFNQKDPMSALVVIARPGLFPLLRLPKLKNRFFTYDANKKRLAHEGRWIRASDLCTPGLPPMRPLFVQEPPPPVTEESVELVPCFIRASLFGESAEFNNPKGACSASTSGEELVRPVLSKLSQLAPNYTANPQCLELVGKMSINGKSAPTIIKTGHPYENNEDWERTVTAPSNLGFSLVFHSDSRSERNYDKLEVFVDGATSAAHCWSGTDSSSWPRSELRIPNCRSLRFKWHTDGSNTDWGFECTVTPLGTFQTELRAPLIDPSTGEEVPSQTIRTGHPYENNEDWTRTVEFPSACRIMELNFDEQSRSERNYDSLTIFTDRSKETQFGRYTGTEASSYPKEPIYATGNFLAFQWKTDSSNVDWGFECRVKPSASISMFVMKWELLAYLTSVADLAPGQRVFIAGDDCGLLAAACCELVKGGGEVTLNTSAHKEIRANICTALGQTECPNNLRIITSSIYSLHDAYDRIIFTSPPSNQALWYAQAITRIGGRVLTVTKSGRRKQIHCYTRTSGDATNPTSIPSRASRQFRSDDLITVGRDMEAFTGKYEPEVPRAPIEAPEIVPNAVPSPSEIIDTPEEIPSANEGTFGDGALDVEGEESEGEGPAPGIFSQLAKGSAPDKSSISAGQMLFLVGKGGLPDTPPAGHAVVVLAPAEDEDRVYVISRNAERSQLTAGWVDLKHLRTCPTLPVEDDVRGVALPDAVNKVLRHEDTMSQMLAEHTIVAILAQWPQQGMRFEPDLVGSPQRFVEFLALLKRDERKHPTKKPTYLRQMESNLTSWVAQDISAKAPCEQSLDMLLLNHALGVLSNHSGASAVSPAPAASLDFSKAVIYETNHPYANNMDVVQKIDIPGARSLRMHLDRRSKTENNNDHLTIYADADCQNQLVRLTGQTIQPKVLHIKRNPVWFKFKTDGSVIDWGVRLVIVPDDDEGAAPEGGDTAGADEGFVLAMSSLRILFSQQPAITHAVFHPPTATTLLQAFVRAFPRADQISRTLSLGELLLRFLGRWTELPEPVRAQIDLDPLMEVLGPFRSRALPETLTEKDQLVIEILITIDRARAKLAQMAAERVDVPPLAFDEELSEFERLLAIARVNEALAGRPTAELPPQFVYTAIARTVLDKVLESPHPCTAGTWEASHTWVDAMAITYAVDPRSQFDSNRSQRLKIRVNTSAVGRISGQGEQSSLSEPHEGTTLSLRLKASGTPAHEKNWGCRVFVHPILPAEAMAKCFEARTEEFQNALRVMNDPSIFTPAADAEIVRHMNRIAEEGSTTLLFVSPEDVFPADMREYRYPPCLTAVFEKLRALNRPEGALNLLHVRVTLWKYYNALLEKCLNVFNFSRATVEASLAQRLCAQRCLVASSAKLRLWKKLMRDTASDCGRPRIAVNRTRGSNQLETTLFFQMMTELMPKVGELRRQSDDNRAFVIDFRGEGSTDAGGPYREAISDICAELQSRTSPTAPGLPVLIPTPNHVHNSGECRDAFVLDPETGLTHGRTASPEAFTRHLALTRFLGVMMGVAMRTDNLLNLTMPSYVWKQLVGQELTTADFNCIDTHMTSEHQMIRDWEQPEGFEDLSLTWSVTALDSKEVELRPNGANIPVSFGERHEFVRAVEAFRRTEIAAKIDALRQGLALVVPIDILPLLTWEELQLAVCGSPEIDLDILKQYTTYDGISSNASSVRHFWRAMQSFTHEQRRNVLRFVTGRSRLPSVEEMKRHPFKLQGFSRSGGNIDRYLPVSHTCFFSLELPSYSSWEICRERFLYAITFCRSIDTDFAATGGFEEEEE